MKLEQDVVLHVAKLARVALSDDEVEMLSDQLSEIIGHFDVLNSIDTEGVEPTAQALPLANVMVEDAARGSMPVEDVLKLAPATDDSYLRVRAVLE